MAGGEFGGEEPLQNCEVTGFVLSGADLPAVYVSGDNASIRTPSRSPGAPRPSTRPSCTPAPPRVPRRTHFSEGRDDLTRAFDDAGLTAHIRLTDHGTWIPLSRGGQRPPHRGSRPAPAARDGLRPG